MRKDSLLVFIMIISIFFIGVSSFSSFLYTMVYADKEETRVEQPIVLQVKTIDYEVYSLNELSFDFVVASIQIESDHPTTLSLDNFITSQQINLSDIQFYKNELLDNAILIDQFELNEPSSDYASSFEYRLLIPIRQTSSDTLTLFVTPNEVAIMFDLSNKISSLNQMTLMNHDETISDENTYLIKINDLSQIDKDQLTLHLDGLSITPQLQEDSVVVAVNLDVEPLTNEQVIIEDARFVLATNHDTVYAQTQELELNDKINLFQQPIIDKTQGSLLFIFEAMSQVTLSQLTKIELKLNTHDEWIVVELGV